VRKVFFEQYRPTKDATAPDEHAAIDLWHTIQAACQDDTDQQIVKLRRQNESYTSIAAILGIAKSTVSDRLKNIENRMNLPNTP
jgi:DNA invertase Pin-like site-specific DNA recombinase